MVSGAFLTGAGSGQPKSPSAWGQGTPHSVQCRAPPHLAPSQATGDDSLPAHLLAAACSALSPAITAISSIGCLVVLPFSVAQGLLHGTNTTYSQPSPEFPLGLPTILTSPELDQEGPVVPSHQITNPGACIKQETFRKAA